jgi:hypothetical protein
MARAYNFNRAGPGRRRQGSKILLFLKASPLPTGSVRRFATTMSGGQWT